MDRGLENILKMYGDDDWEHVSSRSIGRPSSNNISTSSTYNSSRGSASDSASRTSSPALSTAPSIPPFPMPPWHPYEPDMARIQYDYDLPCEFAMHRCELRFHPEGYEDWINHSISHFFGAGPPSTSVCIFCDGPAGEFHDAHDPLRSWRARMLHIGRHHREYRGGEASRPDFHLVDHMKLTGSLTADEYEGIIQFSEREQVPCQNLVEYGYKTPQMKERERRNAKPVHERDDMRKERRQERRSQKTYKPSGKHEVHQESRSAQIRVCTVARPV